MKPPEISLDYDGDALDLYVKATGNVVNFRRPHPPRRDWRAVRRPLYR